MTKRIMIVDTVVLVIYIISAFPAITGIPIHEWIGLGATIVLVAHCAANGIFAKRTNKKAARIGRIVLNVLIIALVAICCVSGIMVSGTVLLDLGFFATGFYFWDPLHALSAKMLMALLLIHVVLNIPVVVNAFKKMQKKNASLKEEQTAAKQVD